VTKIQHLVNVSGGKDSTAVYLRAIELGRPFRAVFADTGNEDQRVYDYVAELAHKTGGPEVETVRADFSRQLAQHREYLINEWPAELTAGRPGKWSFRRRRETQAEFEELAVAVRTGGTITWTMEPTIPKPDDGDVFDSWRAPIPDPNGAWVWTAGFHPMSTEEAAEVVRIAAALHEPTGNPFLDLCISKGRFPSRMAQFCTEELKTLPITTQVVGPMLKAGPVLQWLGIRAEESANRAKQARFNRHESGSMVWRPIFDWTIEQVWAQHRKHGIQPNPLYSLGMGRVGCMPCINCRKSELRNIADLFPGHIERIRQWEEVVASANKRRSATFFPAVTDPTDVERPGTYSRIDTLIEWSRTSRGGRQFDLFFQAQAGGGCTSDLGLCERSAA
jgi:3'-phosphoadenosine 5'-phosphosulfate sulfotransferase (PAPS reductase)/FAD synthetase